MQETKPRITFCQFKYLLQLFHPNFLQIEFKFELWAQTKTALLQKGIIRILLLRLIYRSENGQVTSNSLGAFKISVIGAKLSEMKS